MTIQKGENEKNFVDLEQNFYITTPDWATLKGCKHDNQRYPKEEGYTNQPYFSHFPLFEQSFILWQ